MSDEPVVAPAPAVTAGAGADRLRRTEASSGRAPDFFIVGHPKCGTTALYFMLRSHPQIYMPEKEPRFFAPDLRTRYWRPAASRRRHPHTLENYLALFAGAEPEQLIGEATTVYLMSTTAASRIAEVRPDARIIAVLREPASFLRSLHLQMVRNYDETQTDFRKAIGLEEARRRGKRIPLFSQVPSFLLYSDHVRYVDQLRRFRAEFPSENLLVLIYDDFRADNEQVVRQILRFLDVDETVPIPSVQLKSLLMPRSQLLDQLVRAMTIARRTLVPSPPGRRRARTKADRRPRGTALWRRALYRDPPPPDEEFMLELRRRFKPEVVALSEYLGRDLVTLWGYDRLD
jgi:hypothetical protein